MDKWHNIARYINETLASELFSNAPFSQIDYQCFAERTHFGANDKKSSQYGVPAIVDDQGNARQLFIDDTKTLVYHRILEQKAVPTTSRNEPFGDGNQIARQELAKAALFLVGTKAILKTSPWEIASGILQSIPLNGGGVDDATISSLTIEPREAYCDVMSNWRSEYPSVPVVAKPSLMFIKVEYLISLSACANLCNT